MVIVIIHIGIGGLQAPVRWKIMLPVGDHLNKILQEAHPSIKKLHCLTMIQAAQRLSITVIIFSLPTLRVCLSSLSVGSGPRMFYNTSILELHTTCKLHGLHSAALLLWEDQRRQWVGNKPEAANVQAREPVLRYKSLCGENSYQWVDGFHCTV